VVENEGERSKVCRGKGGAVLGVCSPRRCEKGAEKKVLRENECVQERQENGRDLSKISFID